MKHLFFTLAIILLATAPIHALDLAKLESFEEVADALQLWDFFENGPVYFSTPVIDTLGNDLAVEEVKLDTSAGDFWEVPESVEFSDTMKWEFNRDDLQALPGFYAATSDCDLDGDGYNNLQDPCHMAFFTWISCRITIRKIDEGGGSPPEVEPIIEPFYMVKGFEEIHCDANTYDSMDNQSNSSEPLDDLAWASVWL